MYKGKLLVASEQLFRCGATLAIDEEIKILFLWQTCAIPEKPHEIKLCLKVAPSKKIPIKDIIFTL